MLLSTAHFPPLQYISKIVNADSFYLESKENYQKQSYRNRHIIFGANGPITLSIPIVKGRTPGSPIKEVKIDSTDRWRSIHQRAIESSYRHSPFYEFYYDDLRVFWEKDWKFLYDLNLEILICILELLELDINILETSSFSREVEESGTDYRQRIHPKKPWQDDPEFISVEYTQNFSDRHGFIANLSIIDLIFQTGPEAVGILKKSIRLL